VAAMNPIQNSSMLQQQNMPNNFGIAKRRGYKWESVFNTPVLSYSLICRNCSSKYIWLLRALITDAKHIRPLVNLKENYVSLIDTIQYGER
jgi:hypothetical protein